jgi:hypothetical protein
MKKSLDEPSELDGYDELKPEDQAKIVKAWQEGKVDPADVPESARKPEAGDEDEEGGEKRKKKAAPKKAPKKKADDAEEEEGVEAVEKPKKSRAKAKVGTTFDQTLLCSTLL